MKRVLFALAVMSAWAATVMVHFKTIDRNVVTARVSAALMKNSERGEKLRQMFSEAGCPAEQLQLQPVKHQKDPNVICTVPGETASQVIVGAHYDHAEHGLGAIDDWSGAALLPSLLESMHSSPRRHTFVFIGFTGEEKGLVGSKFYVQHLTKDDVHQIAAMVDFECLGTGPVEVESMGADNSLLARLLQTAESAGTQVKFVNVVDGISDSAPFGEHGVPTLLFHSLTQQTSPLLHTNQDNLAALRMDDYYATYRLAATYLAYLDVTLSN